MLKIHFGSIQDEIYNTEVYYANQYRKEWVTDSFAKKIIADIDDSEVIAPDLIQNNVFGTFSSTELSAGVKTLLLVYNEPKKVFNISKCGDNCAKYLLEIARNRDIKVCLHHVMNFGKDFAVKIINGESQNVITDPIDFLMLAHRYLKAESKK